VSVGMGLYNQVHLVENRIILNSICAKTDNFLEPPIFVEQILNEMNVLFFSIGNIAFNMLAIFKVLQLFEFILIAEFDILVF
jgi:hypothetical protein